MNTNEWAIIRNLSYHSPACDVRVCVCVIAHWRVTVWHCRMPHASHANTCHRIQSMRKLMIRWIGDRSFVTDKLLDLNVTPLHGRITIHIIAETQWIFYENKIGICPSAFDLERPTMRAITIFIMFALARRASIANRNGSISFLFG